MWVTVTGVSMWPIVAIGVVSYRYGYQVFGPPDPPGSRNYS